MRDRSGDCLDFDSDLSENMDCLLPTELNWVIGNKKKRATKLMEIDTQNKVKQPTILVSCKKKHQAKSIIATSKSCSIFKCDLQFM